MKKIIYVFTVCMVVSFLVSCEEITETNINPNAIDPTTADPNLMIPDFVVNTLKPYLSNSYESDVAGVAQYMQKSGWSSGLNQFDWIGARNWDGTYGLLRNIQHFYNRSVDLGYEFHQGVGIVMRAFNFAQLADCYGDVPYSEALSPVKGGTNILPVFDPQEAVYKGIIEELKQANTLLSKGNMTQYTGAPANLGLDVLYRFDPVKWRKLANSLMLRYYMRLSEKLPAYAENGIKEIMEKPNQFPIFESNSDDALLAYLGTTSDSAWPGNIVFGGGGGSTLHTFERFMLSAGFRDVLVEFEDPRLSLWFNKVLRKIAIDETNTDTEDPLDEIRDGVRYLGRGYLTKNNYVIYDRNTWVSDVAAGKLLVDTMTYVGMPVAAFTSDGRDYNLNPNPVQGGANVHVSAYADMYKNASGEFLNMRMITYAEVCFILAEAAHKGWISGTKDWYDKGVKASLDYWKLGARYDSYILNSGVAFNSANALEQIITQKWIANFNVAFESWCDWRRTGLPRLQWGDKGIRRNPPLRYRYDINEAARNRVNYEAALTRLVRTQDDELVDSSWSKMWLLQ